MSNSSHLLESGRSPCNRLREFMNHPGAQTRRFRMLLGEVPLPGQAAAGNKGCGDPRHSLYFLLWRLQLQQFADTRAVDIS